MRLEKNTYEFRKCTCKARARGRERTELSKTPPCGNGVPENENRFWGEILVAEKKFLFHNKIP